MRILLALSALALSSVSIAQTTGQFRFEKLRANGTLEELWLTPQNSKSFGLDGSGNLTMVTGGSGGSFSSLDDVALTSLANLDVLTYSSGSGDWINATRASLGFQPLDSDLTSIAGLTTSSFGRDLLTLADAAALRTAAGLGTLATQSGTISDYLTTATAASTYQPLDADLTDLADGSLTGSKVGSGMSGDNITTGTVPAAQLGSGSSITTKFLRGDSTWQTLAMSGLSDVVFTDLQTGDFLTVNGDGKITDTSGDFVGGIVDEVSAIYDPQGIGWISGQDIGTATGGSLKLDSGSADLGTTPGNGGSINLSGGPALDSGIGGAAGSINLTGGTGGFDSDTSTGYTGGQGGSINLSGGGGSDSANGEAGGSINLSAGGGSIDLTGTGSIQFGFAGTRTTVSGTATADRALSWPDKSGTLAVTADITGASYYSRLSADSPSSSTSFASVDASGWRIPVEANKIYKFEILAQYVTSVSTEGLTMSVSAPVSPTAFLYRIETHTSAGSAGVNSSEAITTYDGTTTVATGTTAGSYVFISGVLHNGSTAGYIFPRFRAETGGGNSVTVKAGSFIVVSQAVAP